jgi:hypothetical protein
MKKTDNFSAEQLEKFRRDQVLDERNKFGMHKFAPFVTPDSQKKRRLKARRMGKFN